MSILPKKEALTLFFGDIFFFVFSLWLSLYLRFAEFPTWERFSIHIVPFSILFAIWVLVYFIAGLYEKHTLILKSKLPNVIFNAQLINSIFAIVFFYSFTAFGITPKTILFIYLLVSFVGILFWRLYGDVLFGKREKQPALLIGAGEEMKELLYEVNGNNRYDLNFVSSVDVHNIDSIDVQEDIVKTVYSNNIKIIAIDFSHEKVAPLLPHLYNLIFSKVRFIDSHRIYEDIFDRIPLSLVNYSWFLENISISPNFAYDFLKRVMDFVLSLVLGIISLAFYPLVYLLIKLDDGGKIFVIQERVGKEGKTFKLFKFRTYLYDDSSIHGREENKVTRVGKFLRKSRIDELPQLWNVLAGDLSLIGPRPELPSGVAIYDKEIPYYNIRHLIKPGLSGWAQTHQEIHPHHGPEVNLTKEKLTYDIYYIKNRSFWLDVKIALKTIKSLLSRTGL
ncbi:MAG: putative colanic acid biosysnthesis UDP-glucose lipid carrier transferase [Parcubacteria bacterium C7867-003]|nr:MAG: putative colanic acid biosysnthesis UDP-glucose lipid carrier transferase [Parcubacteria bacterium C7867-003]